VDQLDAMRVFVTVLERGNLSAGARALGLPLASVSRKLTALEAHLQTRLLTRTTRRMALTEGGRRYLEMCRRVLAEIDETDRTLGAGGDAPHGSLVVTAPIVFGRLHVLPVVVAFLREHPRVDLRLLLDDRRVDLIAERVDVAVRIGALPDSALLATRVGWIREISCASPDYLERRGTPVRPAELASHDCVTVSPLASAERWSYAEPPRGALRAVPVRSRLVASTAEAAIDAACAGLGITRLLSYQASDAIARGRLRAILEPFEPRPIPVHVLHGEGRNPRPTVARFFDQIARQLRADLRRQPLPTARRRR
jgi:DNA-binding transcriptional LysR family regulator